MAQSEVKPLGHGTVQLAAAASHVVPQKKEPLSLQGVLAKQSRSPGHSSDRPLGHGTSQIIEASSYEAPQKNDSGGARGTGGRGGVGTAFVPFALQSVYAKHPSPSSQSLLRPDMHGRLHLSLASSKFEPQKKD